MKFNGSYRTACKKLQSDRLGRFHLHLFKVSHNSFEHDFYLDLDNRCPLSSTLDNYKLGGGAGVIRII